MKFLTIATPKYDFSFCYVGTGAPTTTTPYSACLPYYYTTAPSAGSNVVWLRSASDGILCAANFIGESISVRTD